MSDPLTNGGEFLIRTLFDLYIMAVLLRLLLQWVRADFYNPICQFLITVTNPVVVPLRRLIPGYGGIDFAAVTLALLLEMLKYLCLYFLLYQMTPNLIGLPVLALAELFKAIVQIYFIGLIALVIISWVNPGAYNPAITLLHQLISPLVDPVRRRLPTIGGLDLSSLVVLLGLQLVSIMVVDSLLRYGALLAAGSMR